MRFITPAETDGALACPDAPWLGRSSWDTASGTDSDLSISASERRAGFEAMGDFDAAGFDAEAGGSGAGACGVSERSGGAASRS
ncbi:MAG TPA: hypothetical protein VE404_10170, partial [Verrucomicrobiae bacterium]|nr:hypothetical protein [Verrucomicrobiae bacterium]